MVFCSFSCVLGCFTGKWLSSYCLFSSFSDFYYDHFLFFYSILFFIVLCFSFFFRKYRLLSFLLSFLFLLSFFRFYEHSLPSKLEIFAEQEIKGKLIGAVYKVMPTEKGNKIYLKNTTFQTDQITSDSLDLLLEKELPKKKNGSVLLYDSSGIVVHSGNIIMVEVILQNFRKASNFGQYNEYQYQKSHGMDVMAYSKELCIIDSKIDKFSYYLEAFKRKLEKVYSNLLEEKEASIIKAMILGEKSGLDNDIKKLYGTNGIAHILAISGLHISMLGMIFYNIIRQICLKINWNIKNFKIVLFFTMIIPVVFSICFTIFYGKMTGFSVSTNRAIIMFFLALFANIVGRTYDLLTSASIASLFILIKEPLLINDSGFWLSFGAIFGIAVLFPMLEQITSPIGEQIVSYIKIIIHSKKNIKQKQQSSKVVFWYRFQLYLRKKVKQGLLVSIAIFLATFPIVIMSYFSYPLYGIFLNLLIIPLMSILFPTAFFMGILGLFCQQPASFLAILVKAILDFYETVCYFTERLPMAIQLTGCPISLKIFLYYMVMAIVILIWNKKMENDKNQGKKKSNKKSKKENIWFCRLGICFLCFAMILFLYRIPNISLWNLKTYFLDIGQGDAVVMELPNGTAITVDCGSSDISNAGTYRLLPFLKAKRISQIECAFLTHMDKDHFSAIKELLEMEKKQKYKKQSIIKNLAVPAVLKENEVWLEIKALAKETKTTILYLHKEDEFQIKGVKFQCLYPPDNTKESGNAASLVLKVSYGEFCMLLTGDIEKEGELSFVKDCKDYLKDIDILKVAHHGSKNSTSEEFIKFCQPKVSIISCSKKNRYGHPHQEILERLQRIDSRIFITKDCGQITISTNGKKMKIKCFYDM